MILGPSSTKKLHFVYFKNCSIKEFQDYEIVTIKQDVYYINKVTYL